ncbi:MAG: hypothetical protein OXE99_14880 [Cellvibrionales bacterium]|nr:hypothetical protein [Cellvibrionales bacterium]
MKVRVVMLVVITLSLASCWEDETIEVSEGVMASAAPPTIHLVG